MTDSPETKIARLEEQRRADREHYDSGQKAVMDRLESVRVQITADLHEAVLRCSRRHQKRCPGKKLQEAAASRDGWLSSDVLKKILVVVGVVGTLLGGAYQASRGDDTPKPTTGILTTGGTK